MHISRFVKTEKFVFFYRREVTYIFNNELSMSEPKIKHTKLIKKHLNNTMKLPIKHMIATLSTKLIIYKNAI